MRKLLLCLSVAIFITPVFASNYPNTVVMPLNQLDLTEQQKRDGAIAGLTGYGWVVAARNENPLVGNLQGLNKSKVAMTIGQNDLTIKYLTKEDMANYKFYRRLLSIRAVAYKDMLDCNSKTYRLNPPKTEHIRHLRAAVYAIAKYQWHISEVSDTKIVSSLTAKGRLEANINDAVVKFEHWSDIAEKYVDQENSYIQRVKTVYDTQIASCPSVRP